MINRLPKTMHYKIIHTTTYKYGESVGLCYNIARILPRNTDNQTCYTSGIIIYPQPDTINEYEALFGNRLIYFAIKNESKSLKLLASSEVTKNDNQEFH